MIFRKGYILYVPSYPLMVNGQPLNLTKDSGVSRLKQKAIRFILLYTVILLIMFDFTYIFFYSYIPWVILIGICGWIIIAGLLVYSKKRLMQ